jgi:hypothetical protein
LKAIIKEGDAPRDQNHHPKGPVVQIFEVAIPRPDHERVGSAKEKCCLDEGGEGHGIKLQDFFECKGLI